MGHGIQWPERAPSRQSGISGVKGHNIKRNYLTGKSRANGRGASNKILTEWFYWSSFKRARNGYVAELGIWLDSPMIDVLIGEGAQEREFPGRFILFGSSGYLVSNRIKL